MKKKLIIGGTILLALLLTIATFAYTYTTAGAMLYASIVEAPWATYEPSADQPNWESLLPESQYGSETLRPMAAGDETDLPSQYPSSGQHWEKVDEASADDSATYVSTQYASNWERDLYELSDYTGLGGYETITGVTVYFRFAAGGYYTVQARAAIQTSGDVYEGTTESQSSPSFSTRSYPWATNPDTSQPWTPAEVNALQAGVNARGNSFWNPSIITQVYAVVNYSIIIIEGEVPPGDLFDITPHEDYTGDLLVKIYLTNTGALLKAYQYLNMKVYVADSLEAEEIPNYQILSLENGVVIFHIVGGSAASYTAEIIGGSYRLVSDNPDEWGEGWSITPELYCEVSQR